MKSKVISLFLSSVLLAPFMAQADSLRMYKEGEIPDSSDVARILGAEMEADPSKPKMRGISLDPVFDSKQSQAQTTEKALKEVADSTPDSFSIPVKFAFDSFEILPDAAPQLDAVAKGIKMVQGAKVIVEGHTDAHGPDRYNENLSQLRAAAVKHYLVNQHGINPDSLVTVGMGEWAPADADNPYAAENRRVQFRAAK